ncbi:MAG: phospholipase D-like domain-containing protein [Bdellovibrionota bacterium]
MGWQKVEFYETGDSYYEAVVAEIAKAKRGVLLESYIFRMDHVGRRVLDALCAATGRGVKVFLRIDGVGSRLDLAAIASYCGEAKLDLEVFHPLPFTAPGAYHPSGLASADGFYSRWKMINRRSHRKLIIIDETVAFTGGRNIDEIQAEEFTGSAAWHDLSLRLEGPAIDDLVKAFWLKPFPIFPKNPVRDFLLNYSWRLRQSRNKWFLRRLRKAQERIWIVTPYFSPTPLMLFQLRAAARRGLDVRIILSQKTDVMISRMAAVGLYHRLLSWGVRIFEYEPSLLHRKLWVVDQTAVIGSANFNHRSFIHDLEIDIVLREPPHVSRGAELFGSDQEKSLEIRKDQLAKQTFWTRLVSWFANWFSYWL